MDGDHYKGRGIQPVEYIHANKLDYFQGNVVKYITRWRDKGGIADLQKVIHYVELYIELESKKAEEPPPVQTPVRGGAVYLTKAETDTYRLGVPLAQILAERKT